MAQHDYVIANASGATVRADINNMALAISSNNSGSSAPSTTYAYLWWIDTGNNLLKLRNSANNAWITMPFSITANNTVDINGGNIDGAVIGGSSAAAGTFTSINATATSTITVNDNSTNLDLISTDADASAGPNLDLYRNSSSPADSDLIGQINWFAENDADEKIEYAEIRAYANDVSDGSEDVRMIVQTAVAGSIGVSRIELMPTELVINNDSKDLDFRVESDNDANAFFVQGSDGNVGLGTASPATKLHISQATTGVSSLSRNASDYAIFLNAVQNTNYFQGALAFGESSTQVSSAIAGYDDGGSGAHGLIFATGTASAISEAVRINKDGMVGIGTTSPSRVLHTEGSSVLFGTTSGAHEILFGDSAHRYFKLYTPSSPDYCTIRTSTTDLLTVNSNGNVGIDTTSPASRLHVVDNSTNNFSTSIRLGQTYNSVFSQISSNFGGSMTLNAGEGGGTPIMHFQVDDSEKMRLTSGDLIVGDTSVPNGNNSCFSVSTGGTVVTSRAATNSQTHLLFMNPNGGVGSIRTSGSATAFNTTSDARLKDVTGSARGLEIINALNPVSYNWKADGKADEGLIAQEVLDIVPNAVSGSEEEFYQMDYSKLVTPLVKAIQEQQEQIEQLKGEIQTLKGDK